MPDEFERLRSRRTLLAAEEGDPVLYSESGRERKRALEVTDVGGNAEDGYYLVVQGPRGGTYTIRERDSTGTLYVDSSNKQVTNLRFADVADEVEAEYAAIRDKALQRAYRLMATDDYDYSEWAVAAGDSAAYVSSELDVSETRVVLMAAPRSALDTNAYGSAPLDGEDRQVAFAILVDDITERGAEFAGSSLDDTITSKADVDDVVDKGVVMARNYVEADAAEGMDEAAEAAARILCDKMSTSDHQAIIDFLPRPERTVAARLAFDVQQLGRLVPWGNRQTAYERSIAFLTSGILMEHQRREREALKANTETLPARQWFEEKMGQRLEDIDFSLTPTIPKLPFLADGGMPHTMLDEATHIHLRDVVTFTEDWMMLDAGMVTDGDQRRMIWVNPTANQSVIVSSVATEGRNKWWTWLLDYGDDSTTTLYEGFDFDAALDAATEVIVDDEKARITVLDDGNVTLISENVDEDELGRQAMRSIGIGMDYAGQGLSAAAPVAKDAGGFLGRLGLSAGKATGRMGVRVWSHLWRKYPRQIGNFLLATVGMSLLHHAGHHIRGAHTRIEFNDEGIDVGVNHAKSANYVGPDGKTGLEDWEAVEFAFGDEDDPRRGGYYVMENKATGERQNVRPGEPVKDATTFSAGKRINPWKTGFDRGATLAIGKTYEDIVDGLGRWGVDVTLGMSEGEKNQWRGDIYRPDASGNVGRFDPWKGVEKAGVGAPSGGGGSPSSSSSGSGSGSSGSSRGGYRSQSGSDKQAVNEAQRKHAEREKRREEREKKRKEAADAEKEYLSATGISGDEFSRAFEEHAGRITDMSAKALTKTLGLGMSPSEAAEADAAADTVPRSAEEVEEAVGDADRTEQLRHPNREADVQVVADEADVEPESDSFEERQEDWQQEEADDYYNSLTPEQQEELNETADEAARIRSFQGEVKTEPFDFGAAIEQTKRLQAERRLKLDEEEAFYGSEVRRKKREREEFEEAEEAGFFDEWQDEQRDPADE